MAVLLPNSIFIHIPKTGGSWVRKALRRSGLYGREIGGTHGTLSEIRHLAKDRFTFAFVRHPLWWHRSFWCFQMEYGWRDGTNYALVSECKSYDFNTYIEQINRLTPGFLTNLYKLYLENPKVDFVGRTENLADDLIMALKLAKEKFNEENIRQTEMQNCSQIRLEYNEEISGQLLENEKDVLDKYYSENKEYVT